MPACNDRSRQIPSMFQNSHSLPHLLSPQMYSCAEQFRCELEKLFEPAWHLVGATAELSRDGDFITTEILGRPVLVRNFGGELHAFLNVCTHRHTRLTNCRHGNSPKLACQYHGWEYKADGSTGYIPDAASFRPLPDGPERLKKFRVATRGPLVFVALDDAPQTLPEFLGEPTAAILEKYPVERWRLYDSWNYELPCNWKVVVENTIESYHLPLVHPTTFVNYCKPEEADHEIHPRATIMRIPLQVPRAYRWLFNAVVPRIERGLVPDRYRIDHVFPNLFIIPIHAMMQVMEVTPLTPDRCRLLVRLFILNAAKPTPLSRLATMMWGFIKRRIIRQVLGEDVAIYGEIHQGLKASPFRGTISMREELIFAFQDYVRRECGLAEK
jgi:choline monooxygenase